MKWKYGDDPRSLWSPGLGHVFGLRPCDMKDLSVRQLGDMGEYVQKLKRK